MMNRLNEQIFRAKELMGVITEQDNESAERLRTDQELIDMVDTDGAKRNWEGTNSSTLYRTTTPYTNPQQYQWRGSIVHQALKAAKWNRDAFINQNDDLVKKMMRQGTHPGDKNKKMSLEDVKRFLELMIENYETKKSERDRLESFKTGIRSIVDIYNSELGIDRNIQKELANLLSYLTNKEKNGFDNDRWDVKNLKKKFPNAAILLPPSKVMDIFCKLKK